MSALDRLPVLALGLALLQPPTFNTRIDVVLVDFVVSDKAEHLVGGLSEKDFLVKEDGKERPIVSFTAFGGASVRTPGANPSSPTPTPTPRLPQTAATVILVDDAQMTPGQVVRLRPDLKALLVKVAEGSGSVALVAPASKISVASKLPGGAEELSAAVDRIVGRRFEDLSSFPLSDVEAIAVVRGDPQTSARVTSRFKALNPSLSQDQAESLARSRANDVAFQARANRNVVYGVAFLALDWLAGQPGRHSVVLVSGGFARDPDDVTFSQLVTGSLRVNAPIHFLDARGLQGLGRYQNAAFGASLRPETDEAPFAFSAAADGSSALADDTGGITIRNTNDMAVGLGRVLETMQTYYILGYNAPAHLRSGFHRIQVEPRTKGLRVRARRGYYDAPVPRP